MAQPNLDTVSKILEDLVTNGTFTPQALKQMEDALNKASAAEAQIVALQERLKACGEALAKREKDFTGLMGELEVHLKTIEGMKTRESQIGEREKKQHLIDTNASVAQAKAEVYRECFTAVFRNFNVVDTIQKNTIVSMPPSYAGGSPFTNTIPNTEVSIRKLEPSA